MLSHPKLGAFTGTVPIEIVIVDEASQIEIGDYIPMIHLYGRTIKKLVFIGDDKQCKPSLCTLQRHLIVASHVSVPPHGQGDLHDLKSIFEVSHLRKYALFLDIQCEFILLHRYDRIAHHLHLDRMPVPLGRFISKHVYNDKLHTKHPITSNDCLRFIDCKKGQETKKEHSYVVRSSSCETYVSDTQTSRVRIFTRSKLSWLWPANTPHGVFLSVSLRHTMHNGLPLRTPSKLENYPGKTNASMSILSKVRYSSQPMNGVLDPI
jgi:hypothetical protein